MAPLITKVKVINLGDIMILSGYENLGNEGKDGKCYAWKLCDSEHFVESAAFTNHSKNNVSDSSNICGYTSSVSAGCILQSMNVACKFCRTGKVLPFQRMLTSKEIAKENIVMVLMDIYYPKVSKVRLAEREFAYMGQGEPGYSYTQLRQAIKITDYVMSALNQKVHRHIISTCGIPELISNVLFDIKNHFYNERITFHFSLHLIDNRSSLMPINSIYTYKETLNLLYKVKEITGEKPCVGILLFPGFSPNDKSIVYTNSVINIEKLLMELDPSKVRLSFSELNSTSDIGKAKYFEIDNIKKILNMSSNMGFEAKYFSSFGRDEYSACGMLGGKERLIYSSENLHEIELEADELIEKAISHLSI